jgi:diacylglycerol O-acyltransferase / wax synthase
MDEIKHSPEGALSYGLLGLVGLTPAEVEKPVIDVFTSKASMVLTNVPAPKNPVYLAGTRGACLCGPPPPAAWR